MDSVSNSVTVESTLLVVAGETSGDQHAAGLLRALNRRPSTPELRYFGSGGRAMAEAGVHLLKDVTQLAAIGPSDAVHHLREYWRLYRQILAAVALQKPRLALLVDFPDFNLRLARRLKRLGIPVCYFISPQLWAWRRSRLKAIRRYIDRMLVIFPFEEDFYRSQGIAATYVGNPSMTRLRPLLQGRRRDSPSHTPARVALLPGSRSSEVIRIFPLLLDAAEYIAARTEVDFWAIQAPQIPRELLEGTYRKWRQTGRRPLPLKIRGEGSAQLLAEADCAIIKSGTSTLEAMILQVPFAMVYRMPLLSWLLARPWVNVKTYCLANLIAGYPMVPEFVQRSARPEKIGEYIVGLLRDEPRRRRLQSEFERTTHRLGDLNAYEEAAQQVTRLLDQHPIER